jgi:rhomboid family GlyGly-CTERM serine protease
VARQKERLAGSVPPVTVAIGALAIAAHLCPPLAAFLVYERSAIAGGEFWRLVTCPLVHFSGDHLFFNLLVFAAAGVLIERRRPRLFAHLCLAASLAGSICLFLLSPGMSVFGGLSGIATMAVVFLAVEEAGKGTRGSFLWLAVFALTVGKMIAEWVLGTPLFAGPEAFVIVPSVHVAGGLVALGAYLAVVRRRDILLMPSG